MTKSVFANCLSQNKRSEVEIIEVALFGPIIGQPFVEEDEEVEEENNEGNEEPKRSTITITEEPAQESHEEMGQ